MNCVMILYKQSHRYQSELSTVSLNLYVIILNLIDVDFTEIEKNITALDIHLKEYKIESFVPIKKIGWRYEHL